MRQENYIHEAARQYEPQALAERAGQRDLNGPRQFFEPSPVILANNIGGGESSFSTELRIPTPDSRCRVKVSIVFCPSPGQAPADITGPTTVWIAACDYDQKGIGGSAGRTIPVTNVEGTKAVPTSIPAAAGLLGYSREFVTAADCLEVTFATGSIGTPGTWVLQTRIQPDAVTLDWQEWSEIRRLFIPVNLGTLGSI